MDRGPSTLDHRGVTKSEAPTIDFVGAVVLVRWPFPQRQSGGPSKITKGSSDGQAGQNDNHSSGTMFIPFVVLSG